jgi:hypothetical protein
MRNVARKPEKSGTLCKIITTNSAESTLTNRALTAAQSPLRFRRRLQKRRRRLGGGAEALTQALRLLVKSHGIDPGADKVSRAIQIFVAAVTPALPE